MITEEEPKKGVCLKEGIGLTRMYLPMESEYLLWRQQEPEEHCLLYPEEHAILSIIASLLKTPWSETLHEEETQEEMSGTGELWRSVQVVELVG